MKLAKATLILAMAMVLLFVASMINATTDHLEEEEEETLAGEEEVPSLDSFSLPTSNLPPSHTEPSSSRGLARLLLAKKKHNALKCNKNPRICRAKGSPGPFCCNKKCVDVRTDRLNCGLCGKKCKYNWTCCKGKCVNLAWDNKNCGRCNNRCGAGRSCAFGLCNYAN
ncbi:hypothetical protein ACLOJK_011011 [Asimina triloba]